MVFRNMLIAAGLCASLASSGGGKVGAQTKRSALIPLKLKYHAGETNRYRMTLNVEARLPDSPPTAAPVYSIDLNLVEQEKVVQATADGGGDLAISTVSGSGTVNGNPFQPSINAKPARISFDAYGGIAGIKYLPATTSGVPLLSNMFGSGAMSMHGVFLSVNPVKIGDTWNKRVQVLGLTANKLATVKATFVKVEEVGRYKTAKIHSVLTAPIHAMIDANAQPTEQAKTAVSTLVGTFKMSYDTNIAIAEGKVVRAAGTGDVQVTIQPMTTQKAVSKPVSKKNAANSNQAHPVSHTQAPLAPKMVMKLRLGNDLME